MDSRHGRYDELGPEMRKELSAMGLALADEDIDCLSRQSVAA
jgi:hypothetical protein